MPWNTKSVASTEQPNSTLTLEGASPQTSLELTYEHCARILPWDVPTKQLWRLGGVFLRGQRRQGLQFYPLVSLIYAFRPVTNERHERDACCGTPMGSSLVCFCTSNWSRCFQGLAINAASSNLKIEICVWHINLGSQPRSKVQLWFQKKRIRSLRSWTHGADTSPLWRNKSLGRSAQIILGLKMLQVCLGFKSPSIDLWAIKYYRLQSPIN